MRVHKGGNSSIHRTLAAMRQHGHTVVPATANHVLVRPAVSVHISRFALTLAINGSVPVCCLLGTE